MTLRPLLALALLAGAPAGGSSFPAPADCAHDFATDYLLLAVTIHHVSHECTYYDVLRDVTITDRLDRYDGWRADEAGRPTGPTLFTYEEHSVETFFRDGRTTFHHTSHLSAGATLVEMGYLEERDRSGRQTCHGSLEARPGVVPGRVAMPRSPDYPKCLPPGFLA